MIFKHEDEFTKGRNKICPYDYLWHARDEQSSEKEVGEFMFGLIKLIKPAIVIETGCYNGDTTLEIGRALRENKFGKLISCDINQELVDLVNTRLRVLGLTDTARAVCMTGVELVKTFKDEIDFAFIDSGGGKGVREEEINELLKYIKPLKMFAMHDTAPHKGHISQVADGVDLPKVYFNCPRGLTLFMKK